MNQDLDSRAVAFIHAARAQGYSKQEVCDKLFNNFLGEDLGMINWMAASLKVERLMDAQWPENALITASKQASQ